MSVKKIVHNKERCFGLMSWCSLKSKSFLQQNLLLTSIKSQPIELYWDVRPIIKVQLVFLYQLIIKFMLKIVQNSDIWQIYCIRQPKMTLMIFFAQNFHSIYEFNTISRMNTFYFTNSFAKFFSSYYLNICYSIKFNDEFSKNLVKEFIINNRIGIDKSSIELHYLKKKFGYRLEENFEP
ncbi:hypothetical protein BpHYR1_049828 [Brachionus plicatilis]|uniref:Uncharacterized protein n=1 Tax=Brachionus plicatilis TaxID=10195 RepID=A0A3M7SLK0_BRAPC|nr:hypothetical protein BpHYR1_049828 [Brachionus plicatilis]